MLEIAGVSIGIETIYHALIIILSLGWILALGVSCWRHRGSINFSSIILRTDSDGSSRISKVGILFVFCLILVVVQTIVPTMSLDGNLVMLLTISLGTELTRQGMMVANNYFTKGKQNFNPEDTLYDEKMDGKIAKPISNKEDDDLPPDIPLHK